MKSFVGTSENALRIQIWTALIALLLLKWLHHLSKANWSLSNLASLLRLNLFTYRELTKWLNDPLETPPLIREPEPASSQTQPPPLPGTDLDRLVCLKPETSTQKIRKCAHKSILSMCLATGLYCFLVHVCEMATIRS